ncbi:MAG: protein-glutamate O-methyltransferase family protein [Anaerolineales bacterium]|nr:protein-glutamate O-methyltransferase family protein [Anaerolineales bacterium]MCB8939215.1 protein-glutamate O-methyltransferase family protein [Ardenticatenaceae bacterium]
MTVPKLPVPPPLRGLDTAFTKDSIVHRLPEILQRAFAENDLPETAVAQLTALRHSIPNGTLTPLPDHLAPDLDAWRNDSQLYLEQTWLETPWFFVETYFYRRVIAAVDHFRQGIDPFAYQKRASLRASTAQTEALIEQLNRFIPHGWQPEGFHQMLLAALWGNQADMSMWAADDDAMPNHTGADDQMAHLLVNDATAVSSLLQKPVSRVDFIIDNAGFELIGDLCLADYLLATGQVSTIFFHLKLFPTFVSDATPFDAEGTVAYLRHHEKASLQMVGERLIRYLVNGRLRFTTHPFWTSPRPLWQLPPELHRQFAQAALVICKGDANYRRALGDALWPHTTPFAHIVSYLPTPALFLRTCKSEPLAGLSEHQAAKMSQLAENWLVNGRWGVIQLA